MALAIICAYIIGSFPTAYLVGHLRRGIDIREVGTRNMGAMNVFYSVGIAYGLLVLLVDIGKGVAAVFLARWLGTPFEIQLAAGGAAVIGHGFPVFLRFRGGKGGAVSIGVLGYLMWPWVVIFGAAIFAVVLLITRFPTFSYSLALGCSPFVAWLTYHSGALVLFSSLLLVLLLVRYIPRLKEMRDKAGNWRHVFQRKGLQDRF
jgi:glycerol-3-phosphate acyltransferase PlsY